MFACPVLPAACNTAAPKSTAPELTGPAPTHAATSLRAGLFKCPLAMTDGAARLCQLLLAERGALHHPQQDQQGAGDSPAREGGQEALVAGLQEAFAHLTSRDPAAFWTCGQVRGRQHPDGISRPIRAPLLAV